jgi:hypothetical protein
MMAKQSTDVFLINKFVEAIKIRENNISKQIIKPALKVPVSNHG